MNYDAWQCPICKELNALSLEKCRCGEQRPPAVAIREIDVNTPLGQELAMMTNKPNWKRNKPLKLGENIPSFEPITDTQSDNPYNVLAWPSPILEKDRVVSFVYNGDPIAKGRARKGKNGNMYTPESTRQYEALLGTGFQSMLNGIEPNGKDKFALRCVFYRSNRQRIDCDNLLKAVSDAATGLVWVDDSQVLEVIGRLFLNSPSPRAEIAIYRVEDTSPGKICPVCSNEFLTFPSVDAIHCSSECAKKSKRVAFVCKECGGDYEVVQSIAKRGKGFCSRACSLSYYGKKRTENRVATRVCEDCGNPVSRKEYVVCRACSMKRRSDPNSNYWQVRHKKIG